MSHFEFSVMVALSRQPGRSLQLKDLAVVANGSLSRLSHVISRLEERGWVRRESGPRSPATQAVLTNAGHRELMAAGPIHFQEVRRLVFNVLTPEEVKALEHVAGRINVGLLGEISLGKLARGVRKRSARQST
jgi:DNA-binding MarR family transcriptional regulator